jgi:hypothetical protein
MLAFQHQDSQQTLAEGIAEYYAAYPNLVKVRGLSPQAKEFFRCHDAAHVVFGCSTRLDDEAVVKISSLAGTTAGFGVLQGYRLHESIEIYKQIPVLTALGAILRSVVTVPRTLMRCLNQRERWPWSGFEAYLGVPLRDLRAKFGITVAHPGGT